MKINGLIKKARWEDIPCCCIKDDIEHSHPIGNCKHCKFLESFDSIPKKDFKVNNNEINYETGKVIKKQTKTISEVTLIRGPKYQDVIGWFW